MQWNKTIILYLAAGLIPLFFFSCTATGKNPGPPEKTDPGLHQSKAFKDCADLKQVEALQSRLKTYDKRLDACDKKRRQDRRSILELENKIKRLEMRIHTFEQAQLKTTQPRQAKPGNKARFSKKDPEKLYNRARSLFLEKQFTRAANDFSRFITAFTDHHLTDNAYYWLGECRYSQGKYPEAVRIFKTLVKKFPESQKVPDALLKTGFAYLALEDTNRAGHYLKQVIKRYPFSEASEKAEQKLGQFN